MEDAELSMKPDVNDVKAEDGLRIQKYSIYLISIATVLNIVGAALNSVGIRYAFLIWIFSNTMCAGYFLGAYKKWWSVEKAGDGAMITMYCIFLFTSLNGWMRI